MSADVEPAAEAVVEELDVSDRGEAERPAAAAVVDRALIAQLVGDAQRRGLAIDGEGGLLAQLTKLVVESALEGELTAHLGHEKHERNEEPAGNSRNGTRSETVLTKAGPLQIDVPRDRAGTFEPVAVAKRQRRLGSIEDIVLSLSARGMTHGDSAAHLADVYTSEVSKTTIWACGPGTAAKAPVLAAGAGRDPQPRRRGRPDARPRRPQGPPRTRSANVWPATIVQTCIVHLMRNSFRYAARQDWDATSRGLKPIYQAATLEQAEERLLEFGEQWGAKYPAIVRLRENAWAKFVPFLQFDREIRRIVCTTNAIESVNARIRKAVKARGHFPSEQAALNASTSPSWHWTPQARAEPGGPRAGSRP